MLSNLYSLISIVSFILTLCVSIGGWFAFRHGQAQTANEVQERVINALEVELNALRARLDAVVRENSRLGHIIDTISAALRTRGLAISIDGDMVSIKDMVSVREGGVTTTRIQEGQDSSSTDRQPH
jgi:hypothetical protein